MQSLFYSKLVKSRAMCWMLYWKWNPEWLSGSAVVSGWIVHPHDGRADWELCSLPCPASRERMWPCVTSLGKDQNSEFKVQFLLNAYQFHKHPNVIASQVGTIGTSIMCVCPGCRGNIFLTVGRGQKRGKNTVLENPYHMRPWASVHLSLPSGWVLGPPDLGQQSQHGGWLPTGPTWTAWLPPSSPKRRWRFGGDSEQNEAPKRVGHLNSARFCALSCHPPANRPVPRT